MVKMYLDPAAPSDTERRTFEAFSLLEIANCWRVGRPRNNLYLNLIPGSAREPRDRGGNLGGPGTGICPGDWRGGEDREVEPPINTGSTDTLF